jgi:outer membrane protein TolC
MKILGKVTFIVTIMACGIAVLFGLQAANAEPRALTLDEALEITLRNNRDIQLAKEYRNKVMGIYIEQRGYALPNMVASATGGRSWDQAMAKAQTKDLTIPVLSNTLPPLPAGRTLGLIQGAIAVPPDGVDKAVGVTMTQPLYTWGQVSAAIRAAKYGIASADDQLRQYQQAAMRDVSAAFYDILMAREFNIIAVHNLRQKEAHSDQAKRKFLAGVATEYDVLSAQVAVENARPDAIRSENTIRLARERLRYLLALTEEVDAAGALVADRSTIPEYDDTFETALKRRPELADLKDRIGLASELVKVYGATNKPRVDMKATAGYRELTTGHEDYDGKTWSVGFALTFPFFDGFKTKGKVAQAKSDVASLKIGQAKAIDSISLQVRDAINVASESDGIVTALTGTVAQAERLLQMAEKGYEFGVKTKLDVDDAELNVTAARGNLAKAKRDNLVARVNVKYAAGILGDEKH